MANPLVVRVFLHSFERFKKTLKNQKLLPRNGMQMAGFPGNPGHLGLPACQWQIPPH